MPYLVVKEGPIKDRRFPLAIQRTVLGRDPKCHVYLPDEGPKPKVSRTHAVIIYADGRHYLKDGDGDHRPSYNGTKLNGERIYLPGRTLLKDTDEIAIQNYVLTYCADLPVGVRGSESPSTIEVVAPMDDGGSVAQPAEKLSVLLEITNRLSKNLDLDTLLPEVVESLLQIFKQADRAVLVFADKAGAPTSQHLIKSRHADNGGRPLSLKIVEECLRSRGGLLGNDSGLELTSVICAPLVSDKQEAIGVLMLDCGQAHRKPFTDDDVRLLVGVASQASIALANARNHHDAIRFQGYKRELAWAADVVKSFLPEGLPEIPGYEFFASYEPALEIGGDYYDFVPVAGGQLGVLVGDVSGKNVAAALAMLRFSAEARASLRTATSLADAVTQLNRVMLPLGAMGRFVTLAALQLDPAAHTVTVANAGHPRPLILRYATGEIETMDIREASGMPLGLEGSARYGSKTFPLDPGDTVLLFSDGITEAMDVNDQQFKIERVCESLRGSRSSPRGIGEKLLSAVDQFSAGRRQHDDSTLVCLGRCR